MEDKRQDSPEEEARQAHIVLVGFAGAGKSTVARLLAERLDCDAVDVDDEIERRQGKRITEIFADGGEAAFRAIETSELERILSMPQRYIVATGGGAVLAPRNRELMLEGGHVVALKADRGQIISRVSADTNRPLLHGDVAERVDRLMAERRHAYDFAHLTVDTSSLDAEAVADEVCRWLERSE